MTRTLLLLDLDGVLIHSRGYWTALRATVDHFARHMGQPDVGLTDSEIAGFEACGITSEWDSAPMCVGLMLAAALAQRPALPAGTFEATAAALAADPPPIPRQDFTALARRVLGRLPDDAHPTAAIRAVLCEDADPALHPVLGELFADTYSLRGPVTRVFQHYALGSLRFAETYRQPPDFDAASALETYDRPLLAERLAARLFTRLAAGDGLRAAIYTARPSLPPPGQPDDGALRYSPDAEIALGLLNLDGQMPLIAGGRLAWLAVGRGRGEGDYVKPSPVQALAAIAAAASGDELAALAAAADFYERGVLSGPLATLRTGQTRVVVFEDSWRGIEAVRRAVASLAAAGAPLGLEAVGIPADPAKRKPLAAVADRLAPDINTALSAYL